MTAKNNLLQNVDNYKESYTHNICEIFIKYVAIINEYISQYFETIKITDNVYYNYVMAKGIETLCHVFKTILLYTKNLNVAYVQCQKALYYYIEFMCQIGDSSHTFLRLNSKDATLFVYKKTIFEMNNENMKSHTYIIGTCNISDNINILTDIYNKNIVYYINNFHTTNTLENKHNFLKYISSHCDDLYKNLLNMYLHCDNKMYTAKLENTRLFNDAMLESIIPNHILYVIHYSEMQSNIKKFKEHTLNKLNTSDNIEKLQELSVQKYISWLTS